MGDLPSEFRQILESLLKSDSANPATEAHQETSPGEIRLEHTLWWAQNQTPEPLHFKPRHTYRLRRTTPLQRPRPEPKPHRVERRLRLGELSCELQAKVREFYRLAGLRAPMEIGEFEVRRLFRKLAKRLHPDGQVGLSPHSRVEDFHLLKTHYDAIQAQFKSQGQAKAA